MASIRWNGPSSVPALVAQVFKELRVDVAATGPLIVFTSKETPVPRGGADGAPWLWISGAEVGAQPRHLAISRGAYAVISLADKDARARLVARLKELLNPEPEPPATDRFVAQSPAARAVLRQLFRASRTAQPVLLTGDTGTGKEVSARLLHEWSARRAQRFVPINCAAIPNDLMEGELFGYAKGAFSGATQRFDGQLMAGAGGTVFLDEIDDTPHSLQVKLLRVLEDRVVTRLGESDARKVDFRIVAATNRNLKSLIEQGLFGADLYERLAIVSVHLPPLRERTEDLPALVSHMIARYYRDEPSAKDRPVVESITDDALAALKAYPWPGNVRELRNVLFEALVYKRAGKELLLSDLPRRVLKLSAAPGTIQKSLVDATAVTRAIDGGSFNLRKEIEALERIALGAALERTGGNAAKAAALLGEVGRGSANDPGSTVRAMIRRLGLAKSPPA